MDVSVIIVSYNTESLLRNSLAAVPDAVGHIETETIVVDNNSPDSSADMVAEEFPKVRLVRSKDNLGFAAANNLAINQTDSDYVILLNPDTEAAPGSLATLIQFLESHPDAGACGPMLLNSDGSLQKNGARFPSLMGEFLAVSGLKRLAAHRCEMRYGYGRDDFERDCEVDSISGACIVVRRTVIEKVGPLDPDFFMFYEEVEWCHRIRRRGWKVYYVPEARVTHHWMGSVKQSPKRMTSQLFRSQPLYYRKTSGPLAARLSMAIMVIGMSKNALLHAGVAVKRGLRRAGLLPGPQA